MLETEQRVPSSLYVPQKKQLAQCRWSLVGGSRLCVDPYVRKVHRRREWLIVLVLIQARLCCWILDCPPPSSGRDPNHLTADPFCLTLLHTLFSRLPVHSLPGECPLLFLSPKSVLPFKPHSPYQLGQRQCLLVSNCLKPLHPTSQQLMC